MHHSPCDAALTLASVCCPWVSAAPPCIYASCRQHSRELAEVIQKRPDLQITICQGLQRCCLQSKLVLRSKGVLIGFADPSNMYDDEPESEEDQVHLDVPLDASDDAARA